jgi:hypothetical protein
VAPVVRSSPVHTNAPAAAPAKHSEYVFEPLPAAAGTNPPIAVQYAAVKDVIAAPAPEAAARPAEEKSRPAPAKSKLIVSPSHELFGTVAAVDEHGRFVVLSFPLGQMPQVDTLLPVFRHGVNVGQVKVTGPQRDDTTTADVISGDLQVDDEVRD